MVNEEGSLGGRRFSFMIRLLISLILPGRPAIIVLEARCGGRLVHCDGDRGAGDRHDFLAGSSLIAPFLARRSKVRLIAFLLLSCGPPSLRRPRIAPIPPVDYPKVDAHL
jgi:hypothetical protein